MRLLIVLALIAGLVGCGGKSETTAPPSQCGGFSSGTPPTLAADQLVFDSDRAGLAGILVVLAAGLVGMLAVRVPDRRVSATSVGETR